MQRRTLLKLAAISAIGVPTAQAAATSDSTSSIRNSERITMDHVIIIGGSFAGLAAALQLGRARRKVIVFDTGFSATASLAARTVCSATTTSHRRQSWLRRGNSWRAIPLSG